MRLFTLAVVPTLVAVAPTLVAVELRSWAVAMLAGVTVGAHVLAGVAAAP